MSTATSRGGSAGQPPPAGDGRDGSTGLQLKDLIPLAALPLTFAAALLDVQDRAGVIVLVSIVLCVGTALIAWTARRRPLRWASGVACALLGITAVVGALVRADGATTSPTDPGTAAPTVTGAAPSSTTGPSSTESSPTPRADASSASRCVRSFAAAACSGTGTMVDVSVQPCATSAVLRRWGLRVELDALLVTTTVHDGRCYVGASPPAASAVTGNDLLRAADGTVAPQLRACFLDASDPVPCSTRHTGEFVGDWQEDDGSAHGAACNAAAVRYVGRTIPVDSAIQARVLGRGNEYSCAIISSVALNGTVRLLGGAALPTVEPQ